jgi:hypothetical protein
MNPRALEIALSILLDRYPILNCRIEDRDGAPWLIALSQRPSPLFTMLDKTDGRGASDRDAAERDIAELVWKPFDVAGGPLFRSYAVRFGPAEAYIGLVVHHFVADSVAIGILLSELRYTYESLVLGARPNLPAAGQSYQSYLRAMTTWIEDGPGADALAEVVGRLMPFPQFDLTPWAVDGVDEEDFVLEPEIAAKVRSTAKALGVSPFTVLLAVQSLLLRPYCSSTTIPIKVITAGREYSRLTNIVGNMADRMFVLSDLAGCSTFSDVVRQTQQALSWCRRYALIRYEFIQSAPETAGVLMAAPVFNFRTGQAGGGPSLTHKVDPDTRRLRVLPMKAEKTRPHDAYYLVMTDDGERMRGNIRYGKGHLADFVDQFRNTIREVCDNPGATLGHR